MRPYIQRHDRVLAMYGHFKGKRGYVCRVFGEQACVAWKGVWDHGIWVSINELKRTKRYQKEQEQ
jgi:ribosomal protein L24